MEIALVFGGVVVSLLVEFVKRKWNLSASGVMLFVAGLSLVGGIAYKVLLAYGMWEAFVGVLVAAGAFYAFVIKNVKDVAQADHDAA